MKLATPARRAVSRNSSGENLRAAKKLPSMPLGAAMARREMLPATSVQVHNTSAISSDQSPNDGMG
jgi:hypothetical protein